MCTVLLPPGVNPIAVNKYTNINIDILISISIQILRREVMLAVEIKKGD